MRKAWLALALAVAGTLATTAADAGWRQTRDLVMRLRESGRAQEAYSLAAGSRPEASEVADANFVAGFLALRALGQAETAFRHFQAMAVAAGALRASEMQDARASAGYWMARSLEGMGRRDDAKKLYAASAIYRDTFYGLLSASAAGLQNTGSAISDKAGSYPRPEYMWTDPRVRRELVLAVARNESRFNQAAVSPKGAMGTMQIMRDTAVRIGRKANVDVDLHAVRTNSHYNVALGSKFLSDLLESYGGNVVLTLSAYNAGGLRAQEWLARFGDPRTGAIDAVDWIELIPFRETRDYVKRVTASYVAYIALAPTTSASR